MEKFVTILIILSIILGIVLCILYVRLLKKPSFSDHNAETEKDELLKFDDVLSKKKKDNEINVEIKPIMPQNMKEEKSIKTTFISEETFITGDFICDNNVEIYGQIKGKIECKEELMIFGNVQGDIYTRSLYVKRANIQGDLYCDEAFESNKDTTINGNIQARNAIVKGYVKGNLILEEDLVLHESAVILGDIIAHNLEIAKGAIIKGKVEILQEHKVTH